MKTNRRKFLGKAGLGTFGMLSLNFNPSEATPMIADCRNIINPYKPGTRIPGAAVINHRDVKINVKPVYYALIHGGIWEGPCRYTGGGPGPEQERILYRNQFNEWTKNFSNSLSPEANMLEPVYYEFPEFYEINRSDLVKLEADKEDVDLYVVTGTNLSQYLASIIGVIYKKPVSHGSDTVAYLRSQGLEGYVAGEYGGLNRLISLLRARKAFQQINMLLITDIGIPGYPVTSAVRNFQDLNNRFGIGTTVISYKELSDERNRIMGNKNSMAEVENITNKLVKNAQGVHIEKNIFNNGDVLYYYTVKNLMKKYNCNAYSIECFEWCGSRQPDDWKAFPCLSHSLLIDEGCPSACEGDISALLTQNVFMALTKKSSMMGNMNVTHKGGGLSWDKDVWVKGADTEGAKIWLGHNVPGLKMLGFDKPDLPYEIRNFILAKPSFPGWGGTLKVDFTAIEEKTVTIGRFNPLATKMLVTKGEVIGMRGFDYYGCNHGVILNVQDPEEFELKAYDYGSHHVMVYGDCTRELRHLADMLKIEVEFHNV